MAGPELGKITRQNGVAGQVSYSVKVTYPGAAPSVVQFVGSTFGGPVVMVTRTFGQQFVRDQGRFGPFGPEWVRRFFEGSE